MDPYVVIEHQGRKYKTKCKWNAGKHPVWNEVCDEIVYKCLTEQENNFFLFQEFMFHVNSMNEDIKLKVMDKDILPDDYV